MSSCGVNVKIIMDITLTNVKSCFVGVTGGGKGELGEGRWTFVV